MKRGTGGVKRLNMYRGGGGGQEKWIREERRSEGECHKRGRQTLGLTAAYWT